MSIPASRIVNVIPGVIGTGGNPLAINAVVLTNSLLPPVGAALPFFSADAVSDFFGPGSTEAAIANVYFGGFEGSTKLPGKIFFAQYPSAAVAGYLRGGSLGSMTLTQLQALSGSLTLSINGATVTAASINLSAATSFSNAAAIIQTALGTGVVTYSSQLQAFTITSPTTGASSTVGFAGGTLSAGIKLTSATGAVTSAGSIAGVPATAMDQIKSVTQNWATFMTVFEPTLQVKTAFSDWANTQNKRFVYVGWDTDVAATLANNTASWGYITDTAGKNGTFPIYGTVDKAAFVCGVAASIDFDAAAGRTNFKFRRQDGLAFDVTDDQIAENLIINGYNFYGEYATANDGFRFLGPGSVTGDFNWMDSFINEIFINSQLQLALVELLVNSKSIPFNPTGYTMVSQAALDPIMAAVNFGSIVPNVPLSNQQASLVNQQAGAKIDGILSTVGWYFQVVPATPQTRGLRGPLNCNLWYTDGQSVNMISLNSINIQ